MEHELRILVEAMRQAGQKALELAASGVTVESKADHSPVTTADIAVDRILHGAVSRWFPDDGWLSEERSDDRARLTKKRTWIVDPIDGTRAFLKKTPEFCISAALVENGCVMVGAIFNPSTQEWFTAIRGGGIEMRSDAPTVRVSPKVDGLPVVLVNLWELQHGRFHIVRHHAECRPVGSIAYALAQVAAGRAAAAVMLEGGNEWDVAAGALLIEESGGRITNIRGKTLHFNQPETRLSGILATSPGTAASLRTALSRLTSST
jgi:myo-inositol-1(or 4)-monophosphatase